MKADELVRAADLVKIARDYGIELEKEGAEWKACCPFHQEDTPSWKIFRGRDGKQRYECFGCQAKGDVLDLLKHLEHLPDNKAAIERLHEIVGGVQPPPGQQPVATGASSASRKKAKRKTKAGKELGRWNYPDGSATVVLQVRKYEQVYADTFERVVDQDGHAKKEFRQFSPDGRGGWKPSSIDAAQRVLYRLPEVLRAEEVWLCEGETDADAVHDLVRELGFTATTIPGGAKAKWSDNYTAALKGRRVIICPDTNTAGRDHGARCVDELRGHAASLRICRIPAAFRDVRHYLESGHSLADLEALVEPVVLPAKVIGFPDPPGASAENGDKRGGSGGNGGGGGGDLPPDGSNGPDPRWRQYLLLTDKFQPKPLLANVLIALRLAPEWHGLHRLNEFSLDVIASRPFPGRLDVPREGMVWSDTCDVLLTNWLQHHGIAAPIDVVGRAVAVVAEEHAFHPVREYLSGLVWDGLERIDHWLIDHAGVEDTPYARAVGGRWLISAVARVMQPGCKADCMLILESARQGAFKSTAIKVLGDPWTTDNLSELGGKDSKVELRGVWIIEISELDSMRRVEVGRVKKYLGHTDDRFRPPYGQRAIKVPRQCVFAGTVNHSQYLPDETGGRRFWPVTVPIGFEINIEGLKAARDQLWAEAYARYRQGARWFLDDLQLKRAAEREQRARYEADPWEPRIAEWLDKEPRRVVSGHKETTVEYLLESCIQKQVKDWTQQDKNRVARVLISLKWERYQTRDEGRRVWKYRPIEEPEGDGDDPA